MGRWSILKGPCTISVSRITKVHRTLPSLIKLSAFYIISSIIIVSTSAEENSTSGTPQVKAGNASSIGEDKDLYGTKDNIVLLNVDDIQASIYHSKKAWFVEFYSHKCPHSQAFAPTWKQLAQDFSDYGDLAVLAAIDCIQEKNAAVCQDFGATEYPHILAFAPHSDVLSESSDSSDDKDGIRATKQLNKGTLMLRDENVETMKMYIMDELVKYFPKLSIRSQAENDPYAAYKSWISGPVTPKIPTAGSGRSIGSAVVEGATTDNKGAEKVTTKDKDTKDKQKNKEEEDKHKLLEGPEPMSSPFQSYDKTSFKPIPPAYYAPGDSLPSLNFGGSGAGGAGMYAGRQPKPGQRDYPQGPHHPIADPFHGGGYGASLMGSFLGSRGMGGSPMGNPGMQQQQEMASQGMVPQGMEGQSMASQGMEGQAMLPQAMAAQVMGGGAAGGGMMAGSPRINSVKSLAYSELEGGGTGMEEMDRGPAAAMEENGLLAQPGGQAPGMGMPQQGPMGAPQMPMGAPQMPMGAPQMQMGRGVGRPMGGQMGRMAMGGPGQMGGPGRMPMGRGVGQMPMGGGLGRMPMGRGVGQMPMGRPGQMGGQMSGQMGGQMGGGGNPFFKRSAKDDSKEKAEPEESQLSYNSSTRKRREIRYL